MSEQKPELDAMPFGKWRDVPIEDVPTDYLRWCIDTFDSAEKPDVYELVEAEYIRRKRRGDA